MSEDLSHLIDDICSSEPGRAAAGLQAAAPHREALAPVLIARLMQAAVEPERWMGCDDQPSPLFLPYLAAAWKLKEAHPLIVALLSLPAEQSDAMLGDFITEGGRLTLADTWPGNLRGIESLALRDVADPFARGAALDAAALLCVRGQVPREEVLALLSRCAALPLSAEDENDELFANQIISTALDLKAWELRGTVTLLYERELADPSFNGELDDVLEELTPDAPVAAEDSWRFPPPIADAWEHVSHWHWFDELDPEGAAARNRRVDEELQQLEREEPAIFAEPHTVRREGPKVGRNDPCPCGSGKKYKKCCGA